MSTTRSTRGLGTALATATLLLAMPVHGAATPKRTPRGPAVTAQKGATVTSGESGWKEVDRLLSEQKMEEASRKVASLRDDARRRGDDAELTKALVKEVQIRIALDGYETAVRFLKDQAWPASPLSRATLNLVYAHALLTYEQAYAWEIGKRERVETKGVVDLKAWTKGQIHDEALKAFHEVWAGRAELGDLPVTRLKGTLEPGSYPPGVRGTLRDAVTYLFTEFLADSNGWTPEQSNGLYQVPIGPLLSDARKRDAAVGDPAVHPVVRIDALLRDLEAWHAAAGRREAALEARLELYRRLHTAYTEVSDREAVRTALERRLGSDQELPWWSTGAALQATLLRSVDAPDALVRARAAAQRGLAAHPSSVGGQQCLAIVKSIEAPDYQMTAMQADGAGRRSLELNHRNLPELFFRAFPFDLEKRISSARDYNLMPNGQELETLARSQPIAEWRTALPATPDYRSHRTFVVPPLKKAGAYVVVASARRDFRTDDNRVVAAHLVVSDLVLVTRPDGSGNVEVRTLSGETGRPVAGVEVALFKYDWQQGHHRVETQTSGPSGSVRFGPRATGASWEAHFLFGKKGADLALDASYLTLQRPAEPSERTASLVYTDRSIYRPLQRIAWKVVAFSGVDASYRTKPEAAATVWLVDPNNQRVESQPVKTNAFGTAAGEFTIPTGRPLGRWRVECSLTGSSSIRVEEYKRPTFEATFKEPASPLRLNAKATLKGEARYYFGLPVASGTVAWKVTRSAVYPWWWWWWRGDGGTDRGQVIASGRSGLAEDGTFELAFLAEADARLAGSKKDVTYRYEVTADVTDEGGETRSATRSVRLGFVAVEARVESDTGFLPEGKSSVRIVRTDLDGTPRAGKGTWRLLRLRQPETTVAPADQPIDAPEVPGAVTTPGDRLRPRWGGLEPLERTLRAWADGDEVARGGAAHDAKGIAPVAFERLAPGAYRLRYETVDDFGQTYATQKELIVAGKETPLAVPAALVAESTSVPFGKTARLLVASGLKDQVLFLDVFRGGKLDERRVLTSGKSGIVEIPVSREIERGGFGVSLLLLRDHQLMEIAQHVFVPWDDRELKVELATFRDRIRPGAKETWRVTVKTPSGSPAEAGAAEVLAYMYDRSLDLFGPHVPSSPLSLYPRRATTLSAHASLGQAGGMWLFGARFADLPGAPSVAPDRMVVFDGYGIGGPGRRRGGMKDGAVMRMAAPAPPMPAGKPASLATAEAPVMEQKADAVVADGKLKQEGDASGAVDALKRADGGAPDAPVPLRSDFSETAFWRPQLLTTADGSAAIEFTVPDSVTSWNVWVHAVTRDLKAGSLKKETRSVKELMVRPYVPRFFREGDQAIVRVVVNNASERDLTGTLKLDLIDPETDASVAGEFGVKAKLDQPFTVKAGGGTSLSFPMTVPKKVRTVAFRVTAVSGDVSDGELRPLPVLPSRVHLAQSRFVTLRNQDRKSLDFPDLRADDDPTRINEQLVVTVDAQLFYTVLQALPYLVNYPYECTEQTLNRFVSTGIVSSLYARYPAIGKMAQQMSTRDTPLESFDAADPNRKMSLEESPWLETGRGGTDAGYGLTNVLDPRIAKADRESSLAKLRKAQTANGAFPWWPGGPPSPYMTLYIAHGLAKAVEFKVDVPRDMVQRAWAYLAGYFRDDLQRMMREDAGWEFLTFLNYVASCYPDAGWTGGALSEDERRQILAFSFKHWKQHTPFLKGYLSLTLQRMGRPSDARLVWDSVMDSAKTNEEQGTFWAQEDRSWLWYRDTIETHAFALRTVTELTPKDARRDGLVQWLLLNKKLNQWKSTRATAEVIYSLIHYLDAEGALGIPEDATVTVGSRKVSFTFDPERYTGKKNQIVVPGDKLDPKADSTVVVEKESKGFAFASATWHFSTDRAVEAESGDFFQVSRRYFKRETQGKEVVLKPLADGTPLAVGDQIEVQLSLRSKHEAEYVHLRDPRAAGLEPENAVSRFRWDLGIVWYEETRDSGSNFFFERLPVGEYTFKYRLRANMAGTFRVGPATVQSMYAPEFNAYSAGAVLTVAEVAEGEAIR